MKSILGGLCLCAAVCGCASPAQKEETAVAEAPAKSDVVIENILTRRSIRQYKPQAVNRDTMQVILNCGINAPNGQNKQSWEVRALRSRTCSATRPRWCSSPATRSMTCRR